MSFQGSAFYQSLCLGTVRYSEVYRAHFPLWKVEAKADEPLDIMAFIMVIEHEILVSPCSAASI